LRKEKIINKNTQAKVELTFNNNFSWTQDELRYLLNVAAVDIINKNDEKDIICKCENSNYERCERCWNYFKPGTLNEEKICHRCEDVIKKQTNN
jgi:isoleucyl-tRNA synthetase